MTEKKKAVLGLGGNMGGAEAHFGVALVTLRSASCRIETASALYKTPAWGNRNQPDFINACIELSTALSPHDLLKLCLEIERARGRVRYEKWGPRSLDIDILFYENYESPAEDKELVIPHPFMAERAFVILPLAEISPFLRLKGKTIRQWAEKLCASGAAKGIERLKPGALWAAGLLG